MEKLYTNQEYAQKAIEANASGQKVYVHTYSQETEIEVPVYDEDGNQTGTKKETVTKEYAELKIAPDKYYICYKDNYTDGTINDNFNQEQTQKELERISMLSLTGADVERAIYKAKGMDFDDIIQYLEAQPLSENGQPVVDIKALKIELKANNFYRGNPYVEQIGAILGFSSNQLTKFFETNDYTKLMEE